MRRFPLLFLTAGLVSCAPLPPLVTDPPEEEVNAAEAVPASPEIAATDTAKPFVAIAPESAPDSAASLATEDSVQTAVADSGQANPQIQSSAAILNTIPAMALPASLDRDFRVGILVGSGKASLSGTGIRVGFSADGSKAKEHSGTLKLRAKDRKVLVLSHDEKKADSVWVFPGENGRISLEGKEYRGKFLIVNAAKKLNVINVLSVEDYLKGVVPNEIGRLDSSMQEALKVQAIAARTYAYHHYNSRASLGFDVFATVQDQVYNGSQGESPLANAAIDSTAGVVITYQGNFIEAYYHSTCGGYTEGVETWGLPSVPYLKSQSDIKSGDSAWCGSSSYSSWKKVFQEKELVSMFQKNFTAAKANGKQAFGGIQQIKITSKLPGGRIGELEVLTDKGSFSVRGDRIRWLFKEGSKILPSSKFTIEKSGKIWVLDGSGFGHGIGMCQMGARARAKAGQNFKQILEAYYPGTELQCIPQGK